MHLEIIQERLEREGGISVVQTAPTVSYEVLTSDGTATVVDSPAKLPDPSQIEELREPMVNCSIIAPTESVGAIMQLAEQRRATSKHSEYLSPTRVMMQYK